MALAQSSVLTNGLKLAAPRSLYFLIFAISGFSGLIYESIWSHYLKLFLGHAAYAQSLVLIIFMGGMAIGSWLASRFTANRRSPLMIYAVVELIVGIAALFFHGTFTSLIDGFYSSVLPAINMPFLSALLKWLAASVLIMPQSILLGMTFPLMSAGIIRRFPDTPGGSIAMLYFTNSMGAAIGVLVSGFWLIGLVGLPGTILSAGLLNILLAIIVIVLVRLDPSPDSPPIEMKPDVQNRSDVKRWFLVAAFITGAASFIYEISWIRMLSLVLGATTHSFELMLSAFITGLAFGGLWIKRRIDRIASPVRFSGYVQLIMGVLAMLTMPVFVKSFDVMAWLLGALQTNDAGFASYSAASHAIALSVMLPTTFMAGMTLPLFTYVLIRQGHGEASIGQIYASNTFGAIVGVLFAVHIGLPSLGLKWLICFGAMLDIILGLFLLSKVREKKANSLELAGATLAALGAIALTVSFISLERELLISGIYRNGQSLIGENDEVIYYKDGKTATVALTAQASGNVSLSTNGKPDASIDFRKSENFGGDETTMTMAGSLPMAYMPDAKTIANIGMGSGMTTHTILGYDSVERVDTIEIEPAIIEASSGFGKFVERAYVDPRSNMHIEDAKTFFSLNNSVYDVIIAEPSNPWVSGVSSLFSDEFYATIKRHVREGGLFVQWIQIYEFDDNLAESILKALSRNFSDYVIYSSNSSDLILVARNEGLIGEPDWSAYFSSEKVAAELHRNGLRTHSDMAVRELVHSDALIPLLRHSLTPANSDYFPYVDLNAGRARFKKTKAEMFDQWAISAVPMLEMLSGDTIDFDDLTHNGFHPRNSAHSSALWTFQRIVNNARHEDIEENAEFQGAEMMRLAELVRNYVQHCESIPDTSTDRFAIHNVMANSLPFLNADKGRQLVNTVAHSECSDTDLAYQTSLMDLYRSVAMRDATGMLENAQKLLGSGEGRSTELDGYLLSAAMLGGIVAGRPGEAMGIWSNHGEEAFSGRSLPGDVRLLATLVADSAAKVAGSD